jgi:hypothetical protein
MFLVIHVFLNKETAQMEFTKTEVEILQEAVDTLSNGQLQILTDLQLAYVGGGIAEVAPH